MQKAVIFIVGPTASGKTSAAIRVAKALGCAVVSADSRQVYQEMKIGTARPDEGELATVPHFFIGNISIHENYTAGRFAREVRAWLNAYFEHHDRVVICGGTGMYIKVLLEGVERMPVPESIRLQVRQHYEDQGMDGLVQAISASAPDLLPEIDVTNPQRLMRVLEWVLAGRQETNAEPWPPHWRVLKIGLMLDRPDLYARINTRVEIMLQRGLWKEAETLYPYRQLNALQTVGYQEIFQAMEGLMTANEAVEKIKQHTRNYAKRQLTWFRKDSEIKWMEAGNQEAMVAAALAFSQGI